MSTETPSTVPDMAAKKKREKKDKKRKHDDSTTADSSSKKRKHSHEALETPLPQLDKSHKKKRKHDIEAESEQAHKKKHKRDKLTTTSSQPPNDQHLQSHSPFVQKTSSLYLPLSPAAYASPLQGICAEHISPLLLTYSPQLGGVVLSYANPRLSEHPHTAVSGRNKGDSKRRATDDSDSDEQGQVVLAKSLDEYAVSYLWLTADFTLFVPKRGAWMEGWLSLQNEGLVGLVCYNYFNAVVERDKLPRDWRWVGEGGEKAGRARDELGVVGHWVDGKGEKVEGRAMFRVEDFEASGEGEVGTISILGTLRTGSGE